MCRLETANRIGLVNIAWGHGAGGISVNGTRGRLEVRYDDGGTAPWAAVEHVKVTDADGRTTTILGPSTERRIGDGDFPSMTHGTNTIVRAFAEAVSSGGTPIATGADGLRTLEVTIAAYASGATGRIIDVPLGRDGPAFLRGALGIPELAQSPTSPVSGTLLFRRAGETII